MKEGFYFLATLWDLRDLNSPTRDWIQDLRGLTTGQSGNSRKQSFETKVKGESLKGMVAKWHRKTPVLSHSRKYSRLRRASIPTREGKGKWGLSGRSRSKPAVTGVHLHKSSITVHSTAPAYKEQLPVLRLGPFSSVQSLGRVRLSAIPWTIAHQASLSITNSRS